MKKITLALAVFSAVCLNGFGQTVVDLGYDWNGTAAVAATSGTFITGGTHNQTFTNSIAIYGGTENEVLVSPAGSISYRYWANDIYDSGTYGCLILPTARNVADYIEVSLTENSKNKTITAATINGVSADTKGAGNLIVLYSDVSPFNKERVIGYQASQHEVPVPLSPNNALSLTLPEGCKSFRLVRLAYLTQTSDNPVLYTAGESASGATTFNAAGYGFRLAYISATLVTGVFTNISLSLESSARLTFFSDNGILKINSAKAQNVNIYSLDGCLVKRVVLNAGDNTVNGLAKGLYIINNRKVAVR